jgi:hypothetical protein
MILVGVDMERRMRMSTTTKGSTFILKKRATRSISYQALYPFMRMGKRAADGLVWSSYEIPAGGHEGAQRPSAYHGISGVWRTTFYIDRGIHEALHKKPALGLKPSPKYKYPFQRQSLML